MLHAKSKVSVKLKATSVLSEAGLTLITSVHTLVRRAHLLTFNRVASVTNNGGGQSLH